MTLIDKAEAHDMQTITEQAAKDARDVFESYGSKSREAIDYMEQLIYAALRKTEPALPARGVGVPTDPRPANCRFRLKDEGKPYGRSSCSACGKSVFTGLGNSCSNAPTDGEAK